MKILYVKNNSERSKHVQLKTIIYEEDGQKYVKKQASTKEAIPHLKKMRKSYEQLSASIINPKIKLAKIIDETEDSLTFEFISGISLEKKFYNAIKSDEATTHSLIQEYLELLKTGFKTITFDSSIVINDEFRNTFGHGNYKQFDDKIAFNGSSNIDLIFSNLIYKDDNIYLIDYEWVFEFNVPINFIIFRQFENFIFSDSIRKNIYDTLNISPYKNIFSTMNKNFIMRYITDKHSFYQYADNFKKYNPNYLQFIHKKEDEIQHLSSMREELAYARSIVEQRDQQIQNMLEYSRLKHVPKRVIKKLMPSPLWNILKDIKNTFFLKQNTDITIEAQTKTYSYINPYFSSEIKKVLNEFKLQPRISIIMPVYNVDPKWLKLAIESIENQWYTNWELCIADDKSSNKNTIEYLRNLNNPKIKVIFLEKNLNISGASNTALELATGDYIALMDNDDEITPDALFEIVKAINVEDADFIYSDEDFISTEGICNNPHFKPDFSPDLLLSHNYITHFTCFKKELLDKVGYFNSKFDGAQDYDLFLRLTEQTSNIHHIQKVLYHWRTLETSTSVNSDIKPEALIRGKIALKNTLQRRNINATVEDANLHHYFRVKYDIKGSPLISIIIPFKDKPELLDMSINSILNKSTYGNYEIIGISNNSEEKETFDIMSSLEKKDPRISFYKYNTEFNYADINNHGVNTYAKGEHILLLNNDIEVISPCWIEAMLEHSQRKEVGCVGAKLYYPNDTLQHAGVIIGLGGYAGHSHKMYPRNNPGYFNRLNVVQNLSAVTAACLMIKKSIYNEIDGMNAIEFKVAYNDVDFCLRVLEKGYLNIFTPFAEMYHHESISRGYETTPEKIARFQTEKDALFARHKDILTSGDPYYNPNLTHDKEDFSLCIN